MLNTRIITTVPVAAIILITSAFVLIACGPAAPARRSKSSADQPATPEPTNQLRPSNPAPALAGTRPTIYLHNPEGTVTPAEARPHDR